MAAIASKVSCALAPKLGGSSKLLAVGIINMKVPSANMYGKTMAGELTERPPPWDYKKRGFNWVYALFDGTTKRFNENSKIVVVDGPPAIGKTEFAKGLAEEMGMLYMPPANMDDYYINAYGYDIRNLDSQFHHIRNVSYDEKKFSKDPTGQDGGLDRMTMLLYRQKFFKYVDALAHIFNTGEGVVLEKAPFNDFVYMETAYRQGWIDKESKAYYNKMKTQTLRNLLRPNLIIYLDAPTSVVQANIRKRADTTHPWEKSSPVWENTDYLEDWSKTMKKDYLKEAGHSSRVLVYDWSEGGDPEVVVEDIEQLNLDYYDKYDKQQKDWRLHNEERYAHKRWFYTDKNEVFDGFNVVHYAAEKLVAGRPADSERERLYSQVPGNRYMPGYNEAEGDPNPLFKIGGWMETKWRKNVDYGTDDFLGDIYSQHKARVMKSKREAGDPNWWC